MVRKTEDGKTEYLSFKAEEYEIIAMLSRDFSVREICSSMGVSRAGYYKWKARGKSTRAINRAKLLEAVWSTHAAISRTDTGGWLHTCV